MYFQLEPRALGRSFSGEVLGARVALLAAVVRSFQSWPFAGIPWLQILSMPVSMSSRSLLMEAEETEAMVS